MKYDFKGHITYMDLRSFGQRLPLFLIKTRKWVGLLKYEKSFYLGLKYFIVIYLVCYDSGVCQMPVKKIRMKLSNII